VAHFVQASAARNQKAVTGVTAETAELFLQRVWKGNVRELENVIERGVLLAKGPLLEPEDIAADSGDLAQTLPLVASGDPTAAPVSIWEMERDLIMRTLERVNGNRTHAAKQLEISIRTLRNKLREYRQIETGSANSTGQRAPDTEGAPTRATV
jgi:DNA-binding NtrC family response regulator